MENSKNNFRIYYTALSIIFATSIITSAEILAANVVYVETEAQIGREVVSNAERATSEFVITESELEPPISFVDAQAGATLGRTTNASSGSFVDPSSETTVRGFAKAGWSATFQANGARSIDLDFKYAGFAELSSGTTRPDVTSIATFSFVANLETSRRTVSLFSGSAELTVDGGLDAVLTEEVDFSGLGVITTTDLPRSARAYYNLDMQLDDVVLLSPNERFTISIEVITETYYSPSPFHFGDQITSTFGGYPTLLSSNGSANFTLVPIPATFALLASACLVFFGRRRRR